MRVIQTGILISILLCGTACSVEKTVSIPIQELVEGNGAPDLIATRAVMSTEKVDTLEITTPPIDSWTFTNWQSLRNCTLVWLESLDARTNSRIYRPGILEHGGAYYIARAPRGERAKLYSVGTNGIAHKYRRVKYEAIAFRLDRTNSVVRPESEL